MAFYKLTVLQVLDIIGFRPTLSASPLYRRRFTLLGIFLLNGLQKLGKVLLDVVKKMENGEEAMEQVKRELQRRKDEDLAGQMSSLSFTQLMHELPLQGGSRNVESNITKQSQLYKRVSNNGSRRVLYTRFLLT